MFLPSILAESDFNVYANAIELSDDWENHPAIADIVDVWHSVHQPEVWGPIVRRIVRDDHWFNADSYQAL